MNNKSNTVQALWVGLGYLGTFLVALGSAMVLSRYLSKDEYGTYRQIIYIYTLLQGVFAAGLPSAYSYFLPKLDLSQGKQLSRLLLFFFVILGALLSIVFYWGAPLLSSALDNPTLTDKLRLFSPIPFFLIPTLGIEGLFTAVRKTEQLLVYNITTKFFMFFCLISPVLFWEPSIDKIIYGWIVSAVFSFVIALVFKNKPFLILICSNLLTFFRNLVSAAIMYVVAYIYGNGSLQIAFALPGAIASMIGMLFAPKLKRHFNAKQLFIIATIWHSVCLVGVYFVGMTVPWYLIAILMFFTMLPVGVLNVVPHLMAADTIDYWEHKTGQRQEGITYSLMGLRSKVSSGLKDYFLTFLLGYFLFSQPLGFVEGHVPVQSEYTKGGLFAIYTIIPAVLNLVSIVPMLFYNLTGARIRNIQEELAIRHEERRLAEQAFSYAGGDVEEFGNLSKPGMHAGAVNYSQIREVIGKRRNAQAVADALRAEKADEERILDIEIAASDEKATEAEFSAEGDR